MVSECCIEPLRRGKPISHHLALGNQKVIVTAHHACSVVLELAMSEAYIVVSAHCTAYRATIMHSPLSILFLFVDRGHWCHYIVVVVLVEVFVLGR